MGFKMKGINSLTNNSLSKQVKRSSSPLFETDPSFKDMSEEIEITNSVKDLKGDDFATERTIKTKGKEVEKKLVPEDFEGGENNPEYQKKLAALEIAIEEGKADKYKDQEIKQKRSYDTNTEKNVKTYPNPNTKNGMMGRNFEGSKKKLVTFDYAKQRLMHAYKGDPAGYKRAIIAWAKTNGIKIETAAEAKKEKLLKKQQQKHQNLKVIGKHFN